MGSNFVTVAFALTLLGATSFACSSSSPVAQAETQAVTERGRLQWETPIQAEFVRDLEYHAYNFEVQAGARFTLEITHKGSSMGLNTMMLMYGPPSDEGYRERLAVDYDSGWGGLSKLADMTAEQTGAYVVTVGTANGLDRGRYRLLLSCGTDRCTPGSDPLELTEGEPNTEFMETFNFYESDDCYRNGRAYTYSDQIFEPELTSAVTSIMNLYRDEVGLANDALEYDGEISLTQFDVWLQQAGGLDRETFESAVGIMPQDDYRVGQVGYSYACDGSATCIGGVMVVLIPSWHEVWVVEYGCREQ